jgi:hypothetical protein
MKVSQANSKKPPKFAIANGFAIGTFPPRIPYASPSLAGLPDRLMLEEM